MKHVTLIFASLIICGCTTNKSWVYQPSQATSDKTIAQAVVVPPFIDERENANHETYNWYIYPVVPYVKADLKVPEGKTRHINSREWHNYRPTEDFAKALAVELTSHKLFENAYFSYNQKETNWIIQGYIENTDYQGKRFYYMVGPYAPLLWILGLPATTVKNQLGIRLAVYDSNTNEELFSKRYSAAPYAKLSWIYHTHSDFEYADMLQGLYVQFIEDLKNEL